MKRLIFVIAMLALAGMAWAAIEETVICDQCGKVEAPDKLCSRYSYYVLKRVDVETGSFSCLDYNPPLYKVFCSTDCLREYLEPDKGPVPGSVIIPGEIGTDFITILPYDENPCRGILDQ